MPPYLLFSRSRVTLQISSHASHASHFIAQPFVIAYKPHTPIAHNVFPIFAVFLPLIPRIRR